MKTYILATCFLLAGTQAFSQNNSTDEKWQQEQMKLRQNYLQSPKETPAVAPVSQIKLVVPPVIELEKPRQIREPEPTVSIPQTKPVQTVTTQQPVTQNGGTASTPNPARTESDMEKRARLATQPGETGSRKE